MQTAKNTEQLTPHFLVTGVIAGIIGGVLMMIFTMLTAVTYLHLGFFTPMYAIAVPLIGEQPLMTSVKDGAFYYPSEAYPKFGIQPFTAAPKVTEPAPAMPKLLNKEANVRIATRENAHAL